MKLIAAPILLLVAFLFFTCSSSHMAEGYQWTRAVNTGVKTWPRWVVPIAANDNKLWIYGGKTGTTYEQADDVWFMSRN